MRNATWRESMLFVVGGIGGILLRSFPRNTGVFLVITLAIFSIASWLLYRDSEWLDKRA